MLPREATWVRRACRSNAMHLIVVCTDGKQCGGVPPAGKPQPRRPHTHPAPPPATGGTWARVQSPEALLQLACCLLAGARGALRVPVTAFRSPGAPQGGAADYKCCVDAFNVCICSMRHAEARRPSCPPVLPKTTPLLSLHPPAAASALNFGIQSAHAKRHLPTSTTRSARPLAGMLEAHLRCRMHATHSCGRVQNLPI